MAVQLVEEAQLAALLALWPRAARLGRRGVIDQGHLADIWLHRLATYGWVLGSTVTATACAS
jgi:hypothetical protein